MNNKIFITGVSGNLGKELAKQFLERGDEVWGISRCGSEKINHDLLNNKNFYYSVCDTINKTQISVVFNEMTQKSFLPDAVILNAASYENDIINSELSPEKFTEIFNINFFGYFFWLEKFLPVFQKINKGTFVAISSFTGYFPMTRDKDWSAYPTSKAAVNMLFDSLNWAFVDSGLRFILFAPGRMTDKKTFLNGTYKEASGKIVKVISSNQGSGKVFYPFFSFLIFRAVSFLPYKWLRRVLSFKKI